jgi:carboxyl-terminal processing protease
VQVPVPVSDQKKPRNILKRIVTPVIIGVAIFSLGLLIGNGTIQLRGYKPNAANKGLSSSLDYSSVDTIYKALKDNYDGSLDEAKLLDGLKSGLVRASGDPYTDYFNSEEAKEFYNELGGTFEGIGAELGKDEDNNIIIIAPLAGFPADKAGLKPKDIIAEVEGESTYDKSISDAVKLIRGTAGTVVKLTIVRDGAPQEISITREKISIPSVTHEVRDGIGILTISRFSEDTLGLAKAAATEFRLQGIKGVVLDLRNNPGGLLDSAVGLSSLWLNSKTVLTERRDNVIIETIKSSGATTLEGIPTVVLINEGSASASEITAGALKDNDAATLIGVKSFGKGSVQQPIDLKDGGLLKVTIARWFTPGGKNIDKEGIEPDREVKITPEDITAVRDPQLDTALTELKK